MTTEYRDKVRSQIGRHEGWRDKVYSCPAGKLTIGFGRNLEDRGITLDEGRMLLDNDIEAIEGDLDRRLPGWRDHTAPRRAVLVNMAYNLGIDGLMGFPKLLAALSARDYDGAAREMLDSRWAMQVGARAQELARQMRVGSWP